VDLIKIITLLVKREVRIKMVCKLSNLLLHQAQMYQITQEKMLNKLEEACSCSRNESQAVQDNRECQ